MATGDEPDDLAGPDPDSWRGDEDYRSSRRERGDQPAATSEERATREGPVGGLGREDDDDRERDRELEYER